MWYEQTRVIDQLINMLCLLTPYFDVNTEIHIKIASSDDTTIGELVTDFNTIIGLQFTDTEPETVEEKRRSFQIDTISDLITYVEREDEPQFVGMAPNTSNES
jgi:hypothetical protein